MASGGFWAEGFFHRRKVRKATQPPPGLPCVPYFFRGGLAFQKEFTPRSLGQCQVIQTIKCFGIDGRWKPVHFPYGSGGESPPQSLWWVTKFSFVKINCESWGSVSIERGVPFRSLINKSYLQGHYIPWFQRATKISPGLSLSTECAGFFLKNNDSFKSFPNNIKNTCTGEYDQTYFHVLSSTRIFRVSAKTSGMSVKRSKSVQRHLVLLEKSRERWCLPLAPFQMAIRHRTFWGDGINFGRLIRWRKNGGCIQYALVDHPKRGGNPSKVFHMCWCRLMSFLNPPVFGESCCGKLLSETSKRDILVFLCLKASC